MPFAYPNQEINFARLLKDLVDLCPPYRTIPSNEEPKI
ncbi:hypothetical protein N0824_02382 [Microcystis sp. 0824]|nr:hypothetical protein N0824_02382 [Microcystis sp. 0824]